MDGTELLYSVDAIVQPLRNIVDWMDVHWEIMFAWRLSLFGILWFWGIPKIIRMAFPDGTSSNPEAYNEAMRSLKLAFISLYIALELLNFLV